MKPLADFLVNVISNKDVKDFLASSGSRVVGEVARARLAQKSAYNPQNTLPALSDAEMRYLQAKGDREERALELQKLHLEILRQQHREDIALALKKIQADHDLAHWSGLLSRDETLHLLTQAEIRHRLLLILSEPEISPSCPPSFIHDFPHEARAEVKQFIEQAYSLRSELYPVEFFGKFFKGAVFDTEVKQLQNLLAAVPTVVMYSNLTDEKLYLHLHAWGFPEPIAETFTWNWEEAKETLERQGMTEKQALREIRKIITGLYQWFAALLADLYYLSINPLHEPRLLTIPQPGDIDTLKPFLDELRELQRRVREAYEKKMGRAEKPKVEHIHGWPADKVQDLQRRAAEVLGLPVFFRDKLTCGGDGPEMAVVPPGSFVMGSPLGESGRNPAEGPQHQVTFAQPFAIGRYAVTFNEYDRFCEDTGRTKLSGNSWGRENRPIINVSWEEAQAYCSWLSKNTGNSYRLPSEAEWEYACRAGTTTRFWWGNSITSEQANYDDRFILGLFGGVFRNKTLTVEKFASNPFGLHQVHGNVWEWCADVLNGDYREAPNEGTVWQAGKDQSMRIVRGGSWFNPWSSLRSASRGTRPAIATRDAVGFRLAMTITP